MSIFKQRGNILLFVISGIAMAAAIMMGMFYMTSTSSLGQAGGGGMNRAYYLALAGRDYAIANWNIRPQLTGNEFTVSNTESFSLSIDTTNLKITSTGIVNKGTPFEARKTITSPPPSPRSPPTGFNVSGSGGITSLTTTTGTSGVGKSGATGVSVDTANKQVNIGSGQLNSYGCVWYQGTANSKGSNCTVPGGCNFNQGIRAYFDFQYNTPWVADGFTFAIISSHNNGTSAAPVYINNITDCGGGNFGEYMGYAGGGTTGNGLQPPKIAVEFDPYVSAGTAAVCNPSTHVAQGSSRMDSLFISALNPSGRHASFMYWGDNNSQCSSPSSKTYDDNRHGNGDGTNDPKNPVYGDTNSDGTTHPYISQDFNSFGTVIASPAGRRLSFRLEIDRVDDTTSADYRKYKMRVWLKSYAVYLNSDGVTYYAVYKDSNGVTLDDTSQKFNSNNDYPPDFQQTITLTQTWHDKFDRMIFGWTQGTGGSTQTVTLRNFSINFKNVNDF